MNGYMWNIGHLKFSITDIFIFQFRCHKSGTHAQVKKSEKTGWIQLKFFKYRHIQKNIEHIKLLGFSASIISWLQNGGVVKD